MSAASVPNDQTYEVDLAVIGSGGAAMAAAIEARQRGASAVLVERSTLGGTCVNSGCVPSKAMLAAAAARHAALANPFRGVPTSADEVDLAAVVEQKDELVGWLRQAKYADVATAWGFEILSGTARFRDGEVLEVDGRPLRARGYVVATGAQPYVGEHRRARAGGVPDVDHRDGAARPARLAGGHRRRVRRDGAGAAVRAPGLPGHAWSAGSRRTQSPSSRSVMRRVFAEDGITVVDERAVAATASDVGVAVTTASGIRVEGARVLVATGRRRGHHGPEPVAPPACRPTTAASSWSTSTSAPATPSCTRPATSPAPRSTSTSPPRPGASRPPTPWTRRRNGPWTTPGCRR